MAETIFIKYYEETDCLHGYGVERTVELTRQEAVERMAKALIRADYPNAQESVWAMRWKNPDSKLYYLTMAEAALTALLEGKCK